MSEGNNPNTTGEYFYKPGKEKEEGSAPKWPIIFAVVLILVLLVGWWWIKKDNDKRQGQLIGIEQEEDEIIGDIEPTHNDGTSPISGLICENWNRRPFAIMYSGDMDARRNFRALSQADFVLEMDHRPMHGQPRIMGVFQCATPVAMGPMRSGRTDHISVAGSLDAVYVPWGGSSVGKNILKNRLVDHIDCNGEIAPSGSGTPACRKDNALLASSLYSAGAAFSNLIELIAIAEKNDYRMTSNFVGFHHQVESDRGDRPASATVSVGADYPYHIEYKYDPQTNVYERFYQKKEGAELKKDIDQETGGQVAPKNIITILAKKEAWSTSIDYIARGVQDPWNGIDEEHKERDNEQYSNFELGDPWFDTVSEGPAEFFMDGKAFEGTWKKEKGAEEPFKFFKKNGSPVLFVPGQIWMHVLDEGKYVKHSEG